MIMTLLENKYFRAVSFLRIFWLRHWDFLFTFLPSNVDVVGWGTACVLITRVEFLPAKICCRNKAGNPGQVKTSAYASRKFRDLKICWCWIWALWTLARAPKKLTARRRRSKPAGSRKSKFANVFSSKCVFHLMILPFQILIALFLLPHALWRCSFVIFPQRWNNNGDEKVSANRDREQSRFLFERDSRSSWNMAQLDGIQNSYRIPRMHAWSDVN